MIGLIVLFFVAVGVFGIVAIIGILFISITSIVGKQNKHTAEVRKKEMAEWDKLHCSCKKEGCKK